MENSKTYEIKVKEKSLIIEKYGLGGNPKEIKIKDPKSKKTKRELEIEKKMNEPRGRVVTGGNNYALGRGIGLKYK